MLTEDAATSLYDVYLPYLPENEELNQLEALLSEMLAKTQSELDRLRQATQQA
jgi:hypothetical protein